MLNDQNENAKSINSGKSKPMLITVQLEYLASPIWPLDEQGILTSEPSIIETDEKTQRLARAIENLFSSYYEFDSHGVSCWFNQEQEKKDKDKMLSLLTQLVDRLNEINDGSYIIKDLETERIKAL